ncbi:hypothetical protein [Sphingobacterium sp.]|uniref:hypothetical protein n=1 Tax=Sphingobacterium sp. TaxID=341027 RepID=UPI002FDD4AFC
MEDTIGLKIYDPFKGQTFRITYKGQDYQVRLLKRDVTKEQEEVEILLDGVIQNIVKKNGKWYFDRIDEDQDFANDIWRAISLRYRL